MTEILVAPFSNSAIRDWPAEHFATLIGLLLDAPGLDARVQVIGTANQRLAAREIVRFHPPERATNACGRIDWNDVLGLLRNADCVIGNNSGIAHVSANLGTPTVCIFGGSHQRTEWRPRGDTVVVLTRVVGCSPCHLDHGQISPYGKACLRDITPRAVAEAALLIMDRGATAAARERALA